MGSGQAGVAVKQDHGDHRHGKQTSEFCDKKIVGFILKYLQLLTSARLVYWEPVHRIIRDEGEKRKTTSDAG